MRKFYIEMSTQACKYRHSNSQVAPVLLATCARSVCLSVCLTVCLSVCLSVWMSDCFSVCMPACLTACLTACLPECQSLALSFCILLPVYRVENWMTDVLREMRRTNRLITKEAIFYYCYKKLR